METLYRLAEFYDIYIEDFFIEEFLTDTTGKRPKKKIAENTEEITGLTNTERSIIAVLRAKKEAYTEKLLIKLKNDKLH